MRTSIEVMRAKVKEVYPNWTWSYKVDNMADRQVAAIYRKMVETGKIGKKKKPTDSPLMFFRQMTIWDFIDEEPR